FVLTRSIRGVRAKGRVTFVNPMKTDLKKLFRPFRVVAVLGGAAAYQLMLDRGLMDEIFVTLEPLVFGRGIPMFTNGRKTRKLELVSIRKLNARGTLLLRYRILGR
ncbi:MAG: dihydrofolate reductase family protein, partial [Patescibacteria group bacterium]